MQIVNLARPKHSRGVAFQARRWRLRAVSDRTPTLKPGGSTSPSQERHNWGLFTFQKKDWGCIQLSARQVAHVLPQGRDCRISEVPYETQDRC